MNQIFAIMKKIHTHPKIADQLTRLICRFADKGFVALFTAHRRKPSSLKHLKYPRDIPFGYCADRVKYWLSPFSDHQKSLYVDSYNALMLRESSENFGEF